MGSWWIREFSFAGRTPGISGTWFMNLSRQVLKSLTIFLWSWGAPSFRRCGGRQLYSSTACLKKDDWCMSLSHFGVPLGNSLAMARRLFLVCRGAGIPGFGTMRLYILYRYIMRYLSLLLCKLCMPNCWRRSQYSLVQT